MFSRPKMLVGKFLRKTGIFGEFFHKRDLRRNFYARFGYFPNLRSPRTFNEKIYCRMLLCKDTRLSQCSDKVLVKDYVREKLGDEFLIPTLYVGPQLPPVALRNWPVPFVIKANHGSGMNLFVLSESNLDWPRIEGAVRKFLSCDYGSALGERYYSAIERQILVEPFMSDDGKLPIDYKFYVFGGEPKLVHVDTDRGSDTKRVFYDPRWRRLDFTFHFPMETRSIERPASLPAMLRAASILGKDFDFVRVDFYEVNSRPYFGEMTFTPGAGLDSFEPNEADLMLGEMWP